MQFSRLKLFLNHACKKCKKKVSASEIFILLKNQGCWCYPTLMDASDSVAHAMLYTLYFCCVQFVKETSIKYFFLISCCSRWEEALVSVKWKSAGDVMALWIQHCCRALPETEELQLMGHMTAKKKKMVYTHISLTNNMQHW